MSWLDFEVFVSCLFDGVQSKAEDIVSDIKINAQIAAIEGKENAKRAAEIVSGKDLIDDNNASIRLLNRINDEMQELCKKTTELSEQTLARFEKSQNKLNKKKKTVFDTTITKFSETISKIKKVEFDGNLELQKKMQLIESQPLQFKNTSMKVKESYFNIETLGQYLIGGFAGVWLGNIIKSVELDEKINKASAEKAKLNAECERIKTQCVKMDSMSKLCNSTYETIKALDVLTAQVIKSVKEIIRDHGEDYGQYTIEQRDSVMIMCNFALALNDLICVEMFDANGKVAPQFEKFTGKAKKMIEIGERYSD